MRKAVLISTVALFGLIAVVACNGLAGPGGNPTPDPNTQGTVVAAFLPDGVTLDVSELPDQDAGAKSKNDAALTTATPAERVLRAAARIVHNFHRLADRGLALGAHIRNDMTDPTQTQVTGNFTVNNQQVAYKADFAAFDIDGDGKPDGSGNAVDAPVAIRVWVNRGTAFERLLCALVTTKPSQNTAVTGQNTAGTGNLGAGQLYVKPGAAHPDAPADFQAFVMWNRTDPAHKSNEAFITGKLHDGLSLNAGHERVDVRTEADSSIEKTVRSATQFADNPYGLQSVKSSVHFKKGSSNALISAEATGGGGTLSINGQCVTLPDATLANNGECDGFDVQDMAFIDLPVGGETDFPAGFPTTPTF